MFRLWGILLNQTSGYLAFSQSKIDLFDEVNYELSKEDKEEALRLSGYTKQDKPKLKQESEEKPLSNTGRMWACALAGICNTLDNFHHSMVFSRLRQNLPIRTIQNQIQKSSLDFQFVITFLAIWEIVHQF